MSALLRGTKVRPCACAPALVIRAFSGLKSLVKCEMTEHGEKAASEVDVLPDAGLGEHPRHPDQKLAVPDRVVAELGHLAECLLGPAPVGLEVVLAA
jgi:hypothetical protein